MLSEITDLRVALSPLPACPMSDEGQFGENNSKGYLHCEEEMPGSTPIVSEHIEERNLK